MAKELPYFKFEPSEWENGNIQMLSQGDKGLFIDICSMYWSRLGDLPEKLVVQKLCGGNATALISLYDENIIEFKDGFIIINFLNEQLLEFENISDKNRENARKGWEKRKKTKLSDRNATASISQSQSNAIREDKIREDKRREKVKKDSINTIQKNTFFEDDFLLNEKYIDFLEFRKQIKKPLKEISIKSNIKQLMKLADNNNEKAIEILEQSIANGWQGLFELKKQKNVSNNSESTTSKLSRFEKFEQANREIHKNRGRTT